GGSQRDHHHVCDEGHPCDQPWRDERPEGAVMRGKLMFLGGMAVGFVLGARAGRERYEQLLERARQLRDNPTVQEAAGVIQAQASRIYTEGKDMVNGRLKRGKLTDKLNQESHRESVQPEPLQPDPMAGEPDPFAGSQRPTPGSTL